MKRNDFNSPSFGPILFFGILCVALFVGIFSTVFSFAEPLSDGGQTIPVEAGVPEKEEQHCFTFLAAGQDAVSGLTDVLLLISFDTESKEINMLQIPRDTFLRYTDSSYRKINGAARKLGGLRGLADLLEEAWHIKIDHTIQISLATFARMIDLIGGVPVCVPYDMDYEDPDQDLFIHLSTGEHILYGNEAVQFVRYRSGYVRGDIGRVDAQKIFLAALAKKITTDISVMKLPALISALIGDVKTDLSFRECLSFAKSVLEIDTANITLATLPGCDARTNVDSGAWYYVINRTAALEAVNKYFSVSQITEELFDPERLFTSRSYKNFETIYDSDGYSLTEYRADEINKNGIGINLTER